MRVDFRGLTVGALRVTLCSATALLITNSAVHAQTAELIGVEVSTPERLQDGDEFQLSLSELRHHGERLFLAEWTAQEGGGRPLTKGTGTPLTDSNAPLVFPRNFNRVSSRDGNACVGCHNKPVGLVGGGGDFSAGAFVGANRFDFATFDHADLFLTKGSRDENGNPVVLQTIGNYRASPGLFGAGYIEMLTRQITTDLRGIRDSMAPGQTKALVSKAISFGWITRAGDGSWDVSTVQGLPPQSLATSGPSDPPSLIIHPFHQSGSVVSIREFANNALNHHLGIQSTERFGLGTDPDGDGFRDEISRAEVTALVIFVATLPAPGRMIRNNEGEVRDAVDAGENLFQQIGCASCHIPKLPLDNEGWIYTEPNPYNPPGNLQVGETQTLSVDLNSSTLPGHRLKEKRGVVWVPAFTDFKLHDITTGAGDPNEDPLDINAPAGSPEFFAGNRRFLTRRLWGLANDKPFFHHGKFTTLREAILAHAGEALTSRTAFEALTDQEQDEVIEFLKCLQALPLGAKTDVWHGHGKTK